MSITRLNVTPINRNVGRTEQCESNRAIGTATILDQKYIIATMVLAFSGDPAVRWMYPDPYQYLTHFPRFVQIFGGKAFAQETAYYTDGYSGAALWFEPGVEPDVNPIIEMLEHSIVESDQSDVFAVFEKMSQYHPKEPHWYLPMIGVEPTQQGNGYGSELIKHVLKQCDRDRIPAYLEASKPTNILFYQRHGFDLIDTIQVGASPPIFPMIRRPI